jgi:hypothetical protein
MWKSDLHAVSMYFYLLKSPYTIGRPGRSKKIEREKPPIAAMARDCCILPPELIPNSGGGMANSAAYMVTRIGRARTGPNFTIASSSVKPSPWKPLVACNTKIAF